MKSVFKQEVQHRYRTIFSHFTRRVSWELTVLIEQNFFTNRTNQMDCSICRKGVTPELFYWQTFFIDGGGGEISMQYCIHPRKLLYGEIQYGYIIKLIQNFLHRIHYIVSKTHQYRFCYVVNYNILSIQALSIKVWGLIQFL